jgi:hypothetical protein
LKGLQQILNLPGRTNLSPSKDFTPNRPPRAKQFFPNLVGHVYFLDEVSNLVVAVTRQPLAPAPRRASLARITPMACAKTSPVVIKKQGEPELAG